MGHAVRVVQRQAGVGKRTVWISILTLLSRILGLVREVISAALFGDASKVYDAFLFAWRIPNLFRRFLGEGALATSLHTNSPNHTQIITLAAVSVIRIKIYTHLITNRHS